MANLYKTKRIQFKRGKQKKFISEMWQKLRLMPNELAPRLNVHPRTLNDWLNERTTMPLNIVKRLCKLTSKKLPTNIKILDPYWYIAKGAKAGGRASYKIQGGSIGNPITRKEKWREWWDKRGRYLKKKILLPQDVKLPAKNSELAEFIGIILGDGTIAKYQVVITLNIKDDAEYSKFVVKLIKKLFAIVPAINLRPKYSVVNIVCSRVKIVEFCKKVGLKAGNKVRQQVDIPRWIMANKKLKIACARGLMDTDGCIYGERHKIKGKIYCYPRLAFVNHSIPLRNSFYSILKELGLNPKHRNNRSVHLEDKHDILNYFRLIDTNNPKHKLRIEKYTKQGGLRRMVRHQS